MEVFLTVGNHCKYYLRFSPNNVFTLSGSYGRSQGRCLIRVPHLSAGIFPVNSRVRFDCASSHPSLRREFCLLLVCGILPENSRVKWLLWHVHVHFDCKLAHNVSLSLGVRLLPENSRIKLLVWHVHVHFDSASSAKVGLSLGVRHFARELSRKMALLRCPCAFRLRRVAQSVRPDLAQGFLQFLVRRFCEGLSGILPGAFAWYCTSPCTKLLKRSWWHPVGVLTWSGTNPCEKLFVEILFKSSSRGPCIKILKIIEDPLCIAACMKTLPWGCS